VGFLLLLFDRWESGILPNASVYRTQLPVLPVPALRRNGRRRQLTGTVYNAVSVTLLFGLLWRPDGPVARAQLRWLG